MDYGTNPVPCIEWAQKYVTAAVRGNHDHAVAQRVTARGGPGFRRLAAATRPLHWEQIDPRRLKYLARLPVTRRLQLAGESVYLVHATPRDPMDEYLINDPVGWEARLQGIEARYICVGHTHVQFHLQVGDRHVINPGSVGQPRDGDPRAAYAIIEDGEVHLRRVDYDIDAMLRQMQEVGAESWAIRLTGAVLRSGGKLSREEMEQIR